MNMAGNHKLAAIFNGLLNVLILAGVGSLAIATPDDAHPHQQTQAKNTTVNAQPKFEYEVASIKKIIPGNGIINLTGRIGMTDTPDGFIARFATVKMIVLKAYAVDDYQLTGAPDWVIKERYDIDAKFDSATADELQKLSPTDRIPARLQMLQALLTERFNLTIHREDKDVQVYYLVVAKNGLKLHEVKLDDADSSKPKAGPAPGSGTMVVGGAGGQIRGYATTVATLTSMLTSVFHRFVIDRTGLTEKYDFTLRWMPDENQLPPSSGVQVSPGGASSGLPSTDPSPNAGPSLFTAIQEQLGLKLESAKGPVEFIVIDRVERPSGN
jgi:uncharacterized protein (TIGR03435 family)